MLCGWFILFIKEEKIIGKITFEITQHRKKIDFIKNRLLVIEFSYFSPFKFNVFNFFLQVKKELIKISQGKIKWNKIKLFTDEITEIKDVVWKHGRFAGALFVLVWMENWSPWRRIESFSRITNRFTRGKRYYATESNKFSLWEIYEEKSTILRTRNQPVHSAPILRDENYISSDWKISRVTYQLIFSVNKWITRNI